MKAEITHHRFDDGVHAFDYTLHRKPRLKHRYIRIRNGRPILSVSKRTPPAILKDFLADHAAWIVQQLKAATANTIDLTQPDAAVMWRGQSLPVTIRTGKRNRLDINHNTATFTLKTAPTHETLLSLLQNHYKTHAPEHLLPRVEHWAAIMGLHPTHVGFRRAHTRWGSCSSRNRLSLNTYLMMLSDSLIDYVVVHELAHIKQKNHSKAFWSLVSQYLPDHKTSRKQLRNFESFL